jgi:hypothetical protein
MVAARSDLLAQALQKSLYVSVVNQAGAPVLELSNSDFIVREDNVSREILSVAPADAPMQIAVLVDTSANARQDVSFLKDSLPGFLRTLTGNGRNQVALIGLSERPTILADYTARTGDLTKGLDRIWSFAGTGCTLLDAVFETAQGFKKREAARPVIVAIVAEGAESSYKMYDQVLGPLRDSGAQLHVILLGRPYEPNTDEARSRSIFIERGTKDSGGSRDQLLTAQSLNAKLTQLANVLTHEYRVTYARPQTLIPPERIAVSARKPELTAHGTPVRDQGKP